MRTRQAGSLAAVHGGRRDFLIRCAGVAGLAAAGKLMAGLPLAPGTATFLSTRLHDGRHETVLLDARGHDLAAAAMPGRGHSFAIDPAGGRAVVFARQPGFFAAVLELPGCAQVGQLPLPPDRHFFGHGVFSADASRLYATENDFDAGRGVVGIYDATAGAGWRRLGEFDTAGIGPHELVLLPDGRTLCVANGGLLTHPDYGKTVLNLSTMRPSLVYLDAATGTLLETVALPAALFQLSIRHLAVDAQGHVWFACQHEGPATEQPPLLGRHRRGQQPELFAGSPAVHRDLRNYIGSIAIDPGSQIIATTSPVGGTVAFWDARSGATLGSTPRPDGCGVAPLGDGEFLVSDGFGAIIAAGPAAGMRQLKDSSTQMAWDNHMRRT